jgi:hypothetical protein
MTESDPPSGPHRTTIGNLFVTSTIIALTISIPAIAITLMLHYVIKTNLIFTISAGLVALFIAMGFSTKISKKLIRH